MSLSRLTLPLANFFLTFGFGPTVVSWSWPEFDCGCLIRLAPLWSWAEFDFGRWPRCGPGRSLILATEAGGPAVVLALVLVLAKKTARAKNSGNKKLLEQNS